MTFMIYIEGNIGAGKSTFVRQLGKYLSNFRNQNIDPRIIQEPVDEWLETKESDGKNILEKFYENIDRWSFAFQMNSFISRTKKIQDEVVKEDTEARGFQLDYPLRQALFVERSVYTDRYVFAENCYENNNMTKMEYDIYCKWNDWLSNKFELTPSAYIYLQCFPETASERIMKRARLEEESIPLEYLRQVHKKHENWMSKEMENGIPILTIDANEDFTQDEKMNELYERVYKFVETLS